MKIYGIVLVLHFLHPSCSLTSEKRLFYYFNIIFLFIFYFFGVKEERIFDGPFLETDYAILMKDYWTIRLFLNTEDQLKRFKIKIGLQIWILNAV